MKEKIPGHTMPSERFELPGWLQGKKIEDGTLFDIWSLHTGIAPSSSESSAAYAAWSASRDRILAGDTTKQSPQLDTAFKKYGFEITPEMQRVGVDAWNAAQEYFLWLQTNRKNER